MKKIRFPFPISRNDELRGGAGWNRIETWMKKIAAYINQVSPDIADITPKALTLYDAVYPDGNSVYYDSDWFLEQTANGYLKPNNTIGVSADFFNTVFMPITPGTVISYDFIGHNAVANIAFYNSANELFSYVSADAADKRITGNVTVPEGTAYYRISSRVDTRYGESKYIKYTESNLDKIILSSGINVFKGLKWNVMGDSITANSTYAAKRYFESVSDRQGGITINNYGIGGSTIGGTDSNAMCNRVTTMSADAQIITVFGGVNDYGHEEPTPLGQMGDDDNTTFFGAMDVLCKALLNRYPKALIMFVTPLQPNYSNWTVGTGENDLGFTIYDYADAIIEVCGRYSIPVIDACRCIGFSTLDATQKTTYTVDGLHLNMAGHNKLSYLIEQGLLKYGKGKIITY